MLENVTFTLSLDVFVPVIVCINVFVLVVSLSLCWAETSPLYIFNLRNALCKSGRCHEMLAKSMYIFRPEIKLVTL